MNDNNQNHMSGRKPKINPEPKPEPGEVRVPKSDLRAVIDEAAAIKREMTALLLQLEQSAIEQAGANDKATRSLSPTAKPGGWRQDPTGWAKRHLT